MSRSAERLQNEAQSLIKEVPIDKLKILIEFMEFLIEKKNLRPLEDHLSNPIYDDEPESNEEQTAVAEALEDIKEGRIYRIEDVSKELGLSECPKDK